MTGSVLDVCLALLLVSAAAVTLVGVDTPAERDDDGDAAGVADSLATTTAAVEYTLDPEAGTTATPSPEADRVAHATLAEHLARAAVRSASVDGRTLSPAVAGYRRAVRATVADALASRTEVRAVWRPIPGVDVGSRVRVGPTPPPTATVHAARFSIPVGPAGERTGTATPARVTVRVLFPPERIAAADRDDSPGAEAVVERYRRAGDALGTDAVRALDRGGPRRANRALADALDRRVDAAADESTGDGDTSPEPGRVVVVVRTWSS